ncbi:protein tyrosine phosphatase : Protein tyrosine/serine phosphatase OS=Cesiribacter andamanensis AMV16 GN=ADICEAN_01060 PE=4 SV=1: DSPc [Gemmata massiliana]|uniref:Tyrosine specific protein phosphatases domain-containing protein n=1 Tax=Gemmata massiliana TaxID=1210884 RepID=A0A6P2CVH1_9BACT|nr:tyrosine-protein phosphatase [Gemmata massiliana]VTR92597.1 protein tyrosine phosphatase : Protein tyrosine/serine phosphatase OS=Cesiribacter andamanensis AMV16 GN=ADICEAN_01060 PE=4 SV=1: DSPc [Gemmata massiliana]
MADHTDGASFGCNWISLGNGRLTLWHRPGAKAVSQLKAFGCNCILTLLSSREGAPAVGKLAEHAGLEWMWLPLENGQPPQGEVAESILLALPALAERLDAGRSTLIHCSAGIHRTGMVAYALLRWYGHDEDRALAIIGEMRAHTGEGIQRKQIDWGNKTVPLGSRA